MDPQKACLSVRPMGTMIKEVRPWDPWGHKHHWRVQLWAASHLLALNAV